MNVRLKAAMAIFYAMTTGLIAATFAGSEDRSVSAVVGWINLYLVSVILPAWWRVALSRKIGAHVALTRDIQIALAMPAWCAAAAALIALRLVR